MAIAAGLGSTLGLGVESVVGTPVTPTRFITNSKMGVKRKNNIIQDMALSGSLFKLGNRRVLSTVGATGAIDMGVYDRGLGMIFQQMLGGAPTITSVASRTVTDGVLNSTTTATSATAAFSSPGDVGKSISGTGIPAGTTIASVTNATTVIMSAAATATASAVSIAIGSGVWSQVYQPADTTGKSLTVQSARPTTSGTLIPFTYNGGKITDWAIDIKAGGFATLSLTVDAWNEVTTITYTAPSYVASNLFSFKQVTSMQLGGTVTTTNGVAALSGATAASALTDFQLKGKLNLDVARYFLGSAGIKAEQITNNFWDITGSISAEFANTTDLYVPFTTDAPLPCQIQFTGPVVSGTTTSGLTILCPQIHLNDAAPSIDGAGILKVTTPFDVTSDGINAMTQFTYNTLDSAI